MSAAMNIPCHDLKSERKDVSGGLPQALKIVPVLFYITLMACSLFYASFEMTRRAAALEADRLRDKGVKLNQELARVAQERRVVEAANAWATEVAKWLEGAHNLQPLLVALGRGTGDEATIADVELARNSEIASQIQFTLKMDKVRTQALDQTLEGIRNLDFRAYSAQQQKVGDSLDYNAILVFQSSEDGSLR